MRILLYNPDNGVTRNFMPHLWMFLLKSLTPAGHEVVLIDGNAQPMDEESIAKFVQHEKIGLVGIGAMTRMIAKAYRTADAIRTTGVPVVMGGYHVTLLPEEARREADAIILGDAEPALKHTILAFREDELAHRERAIEHGALDTLGYDVISGVIKAGSRLAIWLSTRL